MPTSTVKAIPTGFHTANVYLIVPDVGKEIEFLQKAFGGEELHRSLDPSGRIMHAEVKVGDSVIMMGGSNEQWKSRPATMYMYVENVDEVFRKAIEAGAKSLGEPKDQFYGDRSGGVEGPNGNWWWIATHIEDVSREESERRFKAMDYKH